MSRPSQTILALCIAAALPAIALAAQAPPPATGLVPAKDIEPLFRPTEHAVSTWRAEAVRHLVLSADQVAAFAGAGPAPRVARCVKLNNYWCIKSAGWNGEIAADGEGHVAFASAVEGAAVAALLLKRYYRDFDRHTALSIITHWAPAQCDAAFGVATTAGGRYGSTRTLAPRGLGNTLRARWLAGHPRGAALPTAGRKTKVRRSVVADRIGRMMAAPTIAAGLNGSGLGETARPTRPMTLDALLMSSPNAPPSRSMLGMPRGGTRGVQPGSVSSCGFDGARIATYAGQAAAGITPGPGGDLELFSADGTPTANLAIMMSNMARVEIGPLGPTAALVDEGIAQAFKPGRNPDRS